ncbi:MAG: PLP-dependent aminotransferase family protein [Clostridiales bacterium]|jgi:2-aminoadipate transaminase|nr:PLP-dependent aminotransferase family protein [Clostridiales bacterium]
MENIEFADRVKDLRGSAIRESFKALSRPGIISFAGGMPAPETYPAAELARIADDILTNHAVTALQYGITEGYAPLIAQTEARLAKAGIAGNRGDSLIITSGGQQAIELTTKALINEGDGIACEDPSFVGALNAFRSYNARLYPVPMERDGMDVGALERVLAENQRIKFIYTIPTFQNPSGITMSLEKRKRLLDVAARYGVFILEDNPYGELRFAGEDVPAVKSMDRENRVIYVGSYSKTVSPGLRVGFLLARSDLTEKVTVCKQVSDVHSNLMAQMMISAYLDGCDADARIAASARLNGKKCALMRDCMEEYFPGNITRTAPEGGLFLWCDLGGGVDSREFAAKCLEQNVAIVSGAAAMPDTSKITSAFRLNFSMASEENIEKGIKALGEVIKGYGKR